MAINGKLDLLKNQAMAVWTYSGNVYNSSPAGTTVFPLTSGAGNPIEYLQRSHIHVYSSTDDGSTWTELSTPADYSLDSAGTNVVLVAGIADGVFIKVMRRTPYLDEYVSFQGSSLLTADQLNTAEMFSMYVDQELSDWLSAITGGGSPGDGIDLDDLGDVTITGPINWDQLTHDSASQQWVNKTPTEIIKATVGLDDLKDADLASLVDKDALRYDGTASQWVNVPSRTIADQQAQAPPWDDNAQATAGAIAERHDNFVSPTLPGSSVNQPGRFWFQNNQTKTLWVWDGDNWVSLVSDTITPTIYPKIIYVDATNGEDFNDGHQLINPKKTIKAAVEQANGDTVYGDGSIILCSAGVYQEELPITITAQN